MELFHHIKFLRRNNYALNIEIKEHQKNLPIMYFTQYGSR